MDRRTCLQDVALLAQACVWALLDGTLDCEAGSGSTGGADGSEVSGSRRRRWFNVVSVRDNTVPTAWRSDAPLAPADLQSVQVWRGFVFRGRIRF
jgi:hypothetical protein